MNKLALLLLPAILAGCASLPSGPSVAVMPAPNKPFEVFEHDDYYCRQYAERSAGIEPRDNEERQIVSGAVTGAAIGAVAGAALGHGHGDAIATGAGVGVLAGTAVGVDRAQHSSYSLQERYDIAYMQCMYAKGNQVPGYQVQSMSLPPPPRRR